MLRAGQPWANQGGGHPSFALGLGRGYSFLPDTSAHLCCLLFPTQYTHPPFLLGCRPLGQLRAQSGLVVPSRSCHSLCSCGSHSILTVALSPPWLKTHERQEVFSLLPIFPEPSRESGTRMEFDQVFLNS